MTLQAARRGQRWQGGGGSREWRSIPGHTPVAEEKFLQAPGRVRLQPSSHSTASSPWEWTQPLSSWLTCSGGPHLQFWSWLSLGSSSRLLLSLSMGELHRGPASELEGKRHRHLHLRVSLRQSGACAALQAEQLQKSSPQEAQEDGQGDASLLWSNKVFAGNQGVERLPLGLACDRGPFALPSRHHS